MSERREALRWTYRQSFRSQKHGDRREGQRQLGGTGPKFRGRPVRTGGRCGEGRAGVNAGHSLKRPRRWRRGTRGLHAGCSPHPSSTAFWAPGSDPLSLLTVFLKRACGINVLHPTSLQNTFVPHLHEQSVWETSEVQVPSLSPEKTLSSPASSTAEVSVILFPKQGSPLLESGVSCNSYDSEVPLPCF